MRAVKDSLGRSPRKIGGALLDGLLNNLRVLLKPSRNELGSSMSIDFMGSTVDPCSLRNCLSSQALGYKHFCGFAEIIEL